MKTFTKTILTASLALFGFSNVANSQTLLKDLEVGTQSGSPSQFMTMNGTMYFLTGGGNTYYKSLWKSDGTLEGTVNINNRFFQTNSGSVTLLEMNNALYYISNPNLGPNGTNRATLWKSNAPDTGAVFLDSLVTRSALGQTGDAQPRNYIVAGNKIFLQMGAGSGFELWVTDGTVGGLHQVVDLNPGNNGNGYQYGGLEDAPMGVLNGKVYFQGSPLADGNMELYSSDGTAAGTALVKEINPGNNPSKPYNWFNYNNELYFTAKKGNDETIWKTDGTTAGTVMLATGSFNDATLFKNALYFGNGVNLWKTDGTAAGTVLVADSASSITGKNNDFLFLSHMRTFSTPPYYSMTYKKTDGTTTSLMPDSIAAKTSFVVYNNLMYRQVDTKGFWATDGTVAGTTNIGSNICAELYLYNGSIYYNGWGTGTGYELWKYTPSPATGINELSNTQTVSVYPNPSNGLFTFQSSSKFAEIKIVNILGEVVYNQKTNTDKAEVNLSNQVKGVYFYQLIDNNQSVKTGKIIVE